MNIFSLAVVFMLILLSQQQSFSQGLGDPIFKEDFGDINDGSEQHVFNDLRTGTSEGVYFKYNPLPYINSIDFYSPQRWALGDAYRDNRFVNSGGAPGVPAGVSFQGSFPASVNQGNWGPVFKNGANNTNSLDGVGGYSITNDSRGYYQGYMARVPDHTSGDYTGYMLVVDAHSSTRLYYNRVIDGLCAGTSFKFSVWVNDLNVEGNTPPQVQFKVYDESDYVSADSDVGLIFSYSTLAADVSPAGTWKELQYTFTMPPGVSEVRLQIENIVDTQYGNDLAIDDIQFQPFGPPSALIGLNSICIGEDPELTASVTGEPFPTNYFQLQRSLPGENNWVDVGTPVTTTGTDEVQFPNPNAPEDNTDYEYRVVVAGDLTTLGNPNCRVVSDPLLVQFYNHTVSIQAVPDAICVGGSSDLTAIIQSEIAGKTYEYFWEESINGVDWTIIDGENGSTINTGPLSVTTQYRVQTRVVGANCFGTGYSEIDAVTVIAPELVITNPAPICGPGTIDITDASITAGSDAGLVFTYFDTDGTTELTAVEAAAISVSGVYFITATIDGCSVTEEVTVAINDCSLNITKSVDPTSISAPATLNYTINVTNEGNVSLTGVVVTDPFTDGVTPLALTGGDTDNDGELDLTEIWTYETSYAADQAAVDAGADIVNTAFVDSNETAQDQASATTTI
ncbi:DUF7507 domain-containing protein, partial [Algoriphagus chordae]